MKKLLNSKKAFTLTFCILFLVGVVFVNLDVFKSSTEKNIEKSANISYDKNKLEDVVYLSDIPYQKAQIAWGNIGLDKTSDNASLSMLIDGAIVNVKKGIWAHATSTVEYDISAYKDYAYFTTYYGLNTTNANKGNGVKFYIYTSVDGQDWTLQTDENPAALKSGNNANYAKIDIRDANYIRLYAHDNGSNASDHAVWADAKLVKEDYNNNVMTTKEEYDEIIKSKYQSGVVADDLKLTLLQRDFIKNIGQYQLRSFLDKDPKNLETLNWFLNNEEALRLWTVGGKPNGTYERALQVLSDLYHTYKEDLSNENETALGTKYKDLYLRMMLSLSLTHSTNVGLWIGGNQLSDAVTRYNIYKQMHLNNKLASNAMFESYTIDEMRGVMITNIDDEEIMWLRDHSTKFNTTADRFNPYKYINYTTGYSYYRPQYYSAENYDKWDAKYKLSEYNITYQTGKPKLWIVFEEGAVCGGLSKTAANLYGVWGYPGRVVGQPGHAAYVYLYNAGGGKYAWQLANSIVTTGWANTGGNGSNGWGTKYATNNGTIKPGSYLLLSQEAQNEYDKFEKAKFILMQADVYKDDRKKLEQIYRDALNEEIINLDAWMGLTDLYLTDETKTDEELYNLAEEIANAYTYHPLPMYDSTRRFASKIKSAAYYSKLMTLQDTTLKKATKATPSNTIYHKEVPVIANAILGVVDARIATFSFDGANAGKIVLSKQLQSSQVSWSYSLDGGNTWTDCHESSVQLTEEELDSITATNDIKIHIIGLPRTEENIYTIDIKQGVFPSGTVSIDDFENRFNGTNEKMEWALDPKGPWQAFSDATPLFKGDVVVYVRMIATGVYTTTTPVHYTFTTNASSLTNRFIPRNKITVKAVSSGGKNNINNMLDGNINSAWYSKESSMGAGFIPAFVTLELDEAKYVSELDYIPYANAKTSLGGYPTGKARSLVVETSMDNTNWTEAATANNLANDASTKKITFNEPQLAKYIRIRFTAINNASSLASFVSVAVLNLYENPTVSEIPLAEVSYNIAKKTNKNVVAELVNENRSITVTNNGGKKTYTFEKNGEFTFEFVDKNGKKGSATAKVDWIDKTPPTLDVQFSTTDPTNENVVATLTFDKENVTILSNIELATNPVDGSKTLTFSENDSIELEFQDELGNIGKKTITVDWIDTEAPTAEFEFNTTNITDREVIATLKPSEEITILNNGGKDTYTFTKNGSFTFKFMDKAGNVGEATVNVNWIAPLPKYTVKYSTEELTKDDVKVTLELENGYQIFNNNASNEYTFTKSGTFEFQYKDQNGNIGIIPVTVDWIDTENPTAQFKYNTTKWTNKNVVATLIPSEEVTILNNDGKETYTFTDNGSFTFEFVDRVGNKGYATTKVDWIDKKAPTATISYSTKSTTSKSVVATLIPSEKVTVLNGKMSYTFRENAEYTFEFVDRAGNKGYATAKVDWIKKDPVQTNNNSGNKNTVSNQSSKNSSVTSQKSIKNEAYKNMQQGNVTVKVPNSIISKYGNISLNYQNVTLSDAMAHTYGKGSQSYEISLKTKDNKEIDLSNVTLTQTVKLDSNKQFDGVYVVRPDNSVVKLISEVNENGEVVFENVGLGKYIISYKDDEITENNSVTDSKAQTEQQEKEEPIKNKKIDYMPYVIGGCVILFVGGIIYLVIRKNNQFD